MSSTLDPPKQVYITKELVIPIEIKRVEIAAYPVLQIACQNSSFSCKQLDHLSDRPASTEVEELKLTFDWGNREDS
jgi:hypothetical protein